VSQTGPTRARRQPTVHRLARAPRLSDPVRHLVCCLVLVALASLAPPARAQDVIRGQVRPLADTTVQVALDSVQPLRQLSDSGSGDFYRLAGWAADVQAATPPGVRQIVAYLDGPAGRGRLLGWARYGLPRPDVGSAFNNPAVAPSGFELVWRVADLPLQTEPVRQATLYLYLDTAQGWVLARLPLAISIWADGGQ